MLRCIEPLQMLLQPSSHFLGFGYSGRRSLHCFPLVPPSLHPWTHSILASLSWFFSLFNSKSSQPSFLWELISSKNEQENSWVLLLRPVYYTNHLCPPTTDKWRNRLIWPMSGGLQLSSRYINVRIESKLSQELMSHILPCAKSRRLNWGKPSLTCPTKWHGKEGYQLCIIYLVCSHDRVV